MKVALLSHFSDSPIIPNYLKVYLKELTYFFDNTVLITNHHKLRIEEINHLKNLKISLVMTENEGYDFGMWKRTIKNFDSTEIEFLCLCNDSCILINSLQEVLNEHYKNRYSICGITDSYEISFHLQSYFLTFKNEGVDFIFDFLASCNTFSVTKDEIINSCEIGLSRQAIKENILLKASFPSASYGCFSHNPCYVKWKENYELGCPFIKKRLFLKSFTLDEKKHYQNLVDLNLDFYHFLNEKILHSGWKEDPQYLLEF